MFKFKTLRRRVHFHDSHGRYIARIERQNNQGLYIFGICFCTVVCGLMFHVLWDMPARHSDSWLYLIPFFVLVGLGYAIAIVIFVWGALGTEELEVHRNELCWTRSVLNWRRVKRIPCRDITSVRAIRPWHGMDNSVEITVGRQQGRIGAKLLQDEAVELTDFLRKAMRVG